MLCVVCDAKPKPLSFPFFPFLVCKHMAGKFAGVRLDAAPAAFIALGDDDHEDKDALQGLAQPPHRHRA